MKCESVSGTYGTSLQFILFSGKQLHTIWLYRLRTWKACASKICAPLATYCKWCYVYFIYIAYYIICIRRAKYLLLQFLHRRSGTPRAVQLSYRHRGTPSAVQQPHRSSGTPGGSAAIPPEVVARQGWSSFHTKVRGRRTYSCSADKIWTAAGFPKTWQRWSQPPFQTLSAISTRSYLHIFLRNKLYAILPFHN